MTGSQSELILRNVGRVWMFDISRNFQSVIMMTAQLDWTNIDNVIIIVIISSTGTEGNANPKCSTLRAHWLLIKLLDRNLCFYNFVENKYDMKPD